MTTAQQLRALLLVVFLFHVDVPDVRLVGAALLDVVDGGHGRQHRVVLVVIAVHAVAADEEQVGNRVDEGPDLMASVYHVTAG